jgi:TRAP-type C4-dicarboxylate transport system permease small subunit
MKLLTKCRHIFDRLIDFLAVVAAILLIFGFVATLTEVTMRYLFNRPIQGVVEVVEYSLLWITCLVATWVLREEGHVSVDVALNQLTPRARAVLTSITSALCALVCLVITWYGLKTTWFYFQSNYRIATPLKPQAAYLVVIIPFGFLILSIQFFRRAWGLWYSR